MPRVVNTPTIHVTPPRAGDALLALLRRQAYRDRHQRASLWFFEAARPFLPSVFTAPAFRAGLRMTNPPGKGATQYPPDSIH
jgi:hypothetical protein